jgi:hypothetical protein
LDAGKEAAVDEDALVHLERFAGLPVVEFEFDDAPEPGERVAWRVRTDNGPSEDTEEFAQVFDRFLNTVDTTAVTHLIVGYWRYDVSGAVPRQLLLEAAPRLPNLKELFFGEAIREEAEISWIEQCDITPLLHAYPALERLDVRGGAGLELSALSSPALKVLRIETAGLDPAVIRAIGRSDLPNLQTLELWLGIQERGGRATAADLAGILSGERLPALTRLGLMNSEIQDEICAAVATAPVVARLLELALSKGALTDDGAEALLSGQPLTHLVELDLRHHYLTVPMVKRLRAALAPVKMLLIDTAEEDHPDEGTYAWYVAVGE